MPLQRLECGLPSLVRVSRGRTRKEGVKRRRAGRDRAAPRGERRKEEKDDEEPDAVKHGKGAWRRYVEPTRTI